ncbi:MAG: ABC transporter permease [Ignavibacteriales bacterium]|nr:ABC transporter permease [Ignavibacteriales bacterium]
MYHSVESLLLNVKESFFMALAAIRTNKLRSILTLLGIAVGVFSIIGVMTAMGVLLNSIQGEMSALGVNTFQVQKYPMFQSGSAKEQASLRNRRDITLEQAMRLKENASMAKLVGMFVFADWGKIVQSSNGLKTNPNISLSGRDIEGFTANSWTIGEGRLYTQGELESARRVAVLGADVVKKIFPRISPLGEKVRIDGQEYEVVGVVQSRGGMLGGNGENFVVIPLTTFFDVYGKDQTIQVKVQSQTAESFDDCMEQTRGILRAARHVTPGADDDFYFWSNDSMIQQFNDLTKYVRLGIMLVSAIALLAAGVGIMNIMLVSVTERTREIGIRKAIGARKTNILTQFVLEAVLLSEFGGVVGIILGVLGGNILAFSMGIPPVIPYDWVAIGFISCSIVGIVFGVYPAWKASNLDPIESLRYE